MTPETGSEKPPTERRKAPRRRVLKAGIVAFNNRFATLPCVVRDISATGARLRIEGSVDAPDHFDLIVEMDGMEAPCEVVSRRSKELSVRFTETPRYVAARRDQVVTPVVPSSVPTLRRKIRP